MPVMGQRELKDRGYLCVMDTWIVKWQEKQDIENLGGGKMLLSVFYSKR